MRLCLGSRFPLFLRLPLGPQTGGLRTAGRCGLDLSTLACDGLPARPFTSRRVLGRRALPLGLDCLYPQFLLVENGQSKGLPCVPSLHPIGVGPAGLARVLRQLPGLRPRGVHLPATQDLEIVAHPIGPVGHEHPLDRHFGLDALLDHPLKTNCKGLQHRVTQHRVHEWSERLTAVRRAQLDHRKIHLDVASSSLDPAVPLAIGPAVPREALLGGLDPIAQPHVRRHCIPTLPPHRANGVVDLSSLLSVGMIEGALELFLGLLQVPGVEVGPTLTEQRLETGNTLTQGRRSPENQAQHRAQDRSNSPGPASIGSSATQHGACVPLPLEPQLHADDNPDVHERDRSPTRRALRAKGRGRIGLLQEAVGRRGLALTQGPGAYCGWVGR